MRRDGAERTVPRARCTCCCADNGALCLERSCGKCAAECVKDSRLSLSARHSHIRLILYTLNVVEKVMSRGWGGGFRNWRNHDGIKFLKWLGNLAEMLGKCRSSI